MVLTIHPTRKRVPGRSTEEGLGLSEGAGAPADQF